MLYNGTLNKTQGDLAMGLLNDMIVAFCSPGDLECVFSLIEVVK